MAVHWHLDGFWLFCGGDGLVSPLSSYVCFLRTDGGVLLNATHIRLPVQAWTAVGARKRITATLSPNASRRSHIKRALMCCNPATICQGGPGTVPGGVPRRCPGREPQLLRDGRRVALPRETRQHMQEGMARRAGCQRSQAA